MCFATNILLFLMLHELWFCLIYLSKINEGLIVLIYMPVYYLQHDNHILNCQDYL